MEGGRGGGRGEKEKPQQNLHPQSERSTDRFGLGGGEPLV